MTPRPDEELDEARLQSLFDDTAELPGGPTLTKLSARAADIPVRVRRRPWWLSLRIALPASAALAGALAVIALPSVSGDVPPTAPVALAAATTAPATHATSEAPPPEATDEEDAEELGSTLAFGGEPPGGAMELGIDDAESDAELEAWLVATADLVDEGG